jgi:hypothetical protein
VATNDLISFEEAEVWIDDGDLANKRNLVEAVITGSSLIIENYIGRNLVTRGTLTEYHWLKRATHELYLSQFPTITVTSVHEDSARGYGADYLKTVNTHYLVISDEGKLIRTSSATTGITIWYTDFEAVKVVYTAGYADTASIPADIKDVCKRHVREVYTEIIRKLGGISNISDAMGTVTRIGPAMLTSQMRKDLFSSRKLEFGKTWTRVSTA